MRPITTAAAASPVIVVDPPSAGRDEATSPAPDGPQEPSRSELRGLVGGVLNALRESKAHARYPIDLTMEKALEVLAPIPSFVDRALAVPDIPLQVKWGMAGTELLAQSAGHKIAKLMTLPRNERDELFGAIHRQLDLAIERAEATEQALRDAS